MASDERPDRISQPRRKLLRASAATLGSAALGQIPWQKPSVKSFFGVPGAWAQPTGMLEIEMRDRIGTLSPGTPDPGAGQDQWSFEVFEASTTLTINASSDNGFLDIEIYLYAPGAVGPGMTNLLTGNGFGFDTAGLGAPEMTVFVVTMPGVYTLAIEDTRSPLDPIVADDYTILVTGDKPLGPPTLVIDEGPESDAPEGDGGSL